MVAKRSFAFFVCVTSVAHTFLILEETNMADTYKKMMDDTFKKYGVKKKEKNQKENEK